MNVLGLFSHPTLLTKQPPGCKEDFLDLIAQAQKTDNQIYTNKELTVFSFSLNAALPAITNIIYSPYYILSNAYKLAKEKLNHQNEHFKEAKIQIAVHIIHFITSCLTPLLYLTYAGIFILQVNILAPVIFALSLTACTLGLVVNTFQLIKQFQFIKEFNIDPLLCISKSLQALENGELPKFLKNLDKLINSLRKNTNLSENLIGNLEKIQNNPVDLEKSKDLIKADLRELEKLFIIDSLKNLESQYLDLNEKEKKNLLKDSLHNLDTLPYPTAVDKSLKKIQNRFKEKKIILSKRIDVGLALDVTKNYKSILKALDDNNEVEFKKAKDLGKKLLFKLSQNSFLKIDIIITNIALYALSIGICVLSTFFHIGTAMAAVIFIGSSLLYYINNLNIYGNLQSKEDHFDWKNCIPSWMISIKNAFTGLTRHPKDLSKVEAVNITALIEKKSQEQLPSCL